MPTIISGATSPAARAIARIMPVRMPGAAAGTTTRRMVSNLVAPRASEPSRTMRGTAARPFLGRHDHHRHGEQRQRQGRPQDAAGAEGRRRQRLGVEEPVDGAADQVDEEAEAEDAEDDRRHARQVVDRDAHHAHQRPLLGVLAQVERGEHAERRHGEGHEEDHHHRAEDGREDAALGVRLARIVADELPDPRRRRAAACRGRPSRWAGWRARRCRRASPWSRRRPSRITRVSAWNCSRICGQAVGELGVLGLAPGELAVDLGLAPLRCSAGRQVFSSSRRLLVEPQALDPVVDVADLALLQVLDLLPLRDFFARAGARTPSRPPPGPVASTCPPRRSSAMVP